VRVLLSDGSGLTARQVATQLGAGGHEVHVVSPDPLCLTRFTRHVRRVHSVPPYGRDPFAWLDATLRVLARGFDALVATHEQVAVLSREAGRVSDLGVAVALPPFDALRRLQDKLSARATLSELSLPQPDTEIAHSGPELLDAGPLPVYVKTPIGTATIGVRHICNRLELERAAQALEEEGAFADGGVLVQQPVAGPLAMVQAVFDRGRLIARHANLRVRVGVNGGASNKRSVHVADLDGQVARLGEALCWHGALSLDAVLTPDGPRWIDVNPRLVEPGSAWRSGVDLVEALMSVTMGQSPEPVPRGRPGVQTHQLLIALLGAAQQRGSRRAVLRELLAGVRGRGPYRGSAEELTPLHLDLRAGIPVAGAASALCVAPGLWHALAAGAIENYALTPAAWRAICRPRALVRPSRPA
jgi:predicted ATP-grasp superfamily ATP-dependent carboligase